ncbi:MAG: hypothetical protein RLZZ367_2184, partial [Bacteroidota bacterium]
MYWLRAIGAACSDGDKLYMHLLVAILCL